MHINGGIVGALFLITLVIYAMRRGRTILIRHGGHAVRGKQMKLLVMTAMLGASGPLAAVAVADQSVDSDMSHADTYVKDSVITTKVKAKLAEKHLATLTNIQVNTDRQGVVWLSGEAPTQDAIDLAVMVAQSTDGVIRVHNNIRVQQ
jgi:hyperosmotically inducible periplasmic protein